MSVGCGSDEQVDNPGTRLAPGGRHSRWLAAAGLVIFTVLVVGGYRMGWGWTGFAGNKLWDWIQLLLVPVLVPVVFSWLSAHLGEEGEAAARSRRTESRLSEPARVADAAIQPPS